MPIKTETGWKCNVCGLEHPRDIDALSCEQEHEMIYVAFKRDDLYKLIQFVYTGDLSLLTDSLRNTLMKYKSQMKGKSNEIK